MKYYINLHTRQWYPMWTIYWNNKKKLIEEAQEQMERLKKSDLKRHYLHINQEEDDRVESRKDDLFDDLNNILFSKHSELTEYIKKWLIKHKLVDDDRIVGELASDFIDQKELYDLDYED